MPVNKVDLSDSSKAFQQAQAQISRNPANQKDPIYNLGAAMHNHFVGVGSSQVKIADGLNDVLERLERIENMLKVAAGQRRP
jgi:hypothetical protein